jgi:hypothetical protein
MHRSVLETPQPLAYDLRVAGHYFDRDIYVGRSVRSCEGGWEEGKGRGKEDFVNGNIVVD